MGKKRTVGKPRTRRTYSQEFKAEAVEMLLDGHSAESVARNLGLSRTNLLYRWKAKLVAKVAPWHQRSTSACASSKKSCDAPSGSATS